MCKVRSVRTSRPEDPLGRRGNVRCYCLLTVLSQAFWRRSTSSSKYASRDVHVDTLPQGI